MSDAQSETKRLENDDSGVKLMDRAAYYFSRDYNPWPAPQPINSDSFQKLSEPPEPAKKYGGGFGENANFFGIGTRPRFNDFSGFTLRKEKPVAARPSLLGPGVLASSRLAPSDLAIPPSKERCATQTSPETITNVSRSGSGFGSFGFTSSLRSEALTPTKRPRSGRRTGRRGRSGPGHCFHCQEHGHISRLCPKKAVEDADEFDEVEANRFLDDEILAGSRKPASLIGRDGGSLQSAKLENQKARASYYDGYGYGANSTTSTSTITANNSIGSKPVAAMAAKYAASGAAVSPESDKFSEQLDNALKLTVVKPTPSVTPPRGLTSSAIPKPPVGRISSSNKTEAAPPPPVKSTSLGLRDRIKEVSSETLTIETRRTVMLDRDTRFEETTIIRFPSVLPPNVRVITAQFVPVSSQVPGDIIKEKF